MAKKLSKPKYLHHKARNRGRVRIDGKDVYLDGEYGSQESLDHYDRVVREWLLSQDVSRCTLTIDDLCILYLEHADAYYVKNGQPTHEPNNIRIALRPLVEVCGTKRAADFGPSDLKRVRERMIENGNVRTSINRMIGRIKRMFRWAATEEHVQPEVHMRLATLDGLRKGRSKAKESEPVKPVPEKFIDAIEPHVSRQVWGMVQLQRFTGMRPGEVVQMRGRDINTGGKIWEYVPESHKTEHHDKERVIFLGPKAQAIIREYLKTGLEAYLFSPADARKEFDEERKRNRKTPMTPSQRARKRKAKPARKPGGCYTVCSYGQAVRKGCEKAGVPHWNPHRLRHNAATAIRREFGLEASRTILGHSSVVITELYAEQDRELAKGVIAKIG